MQVQVFVRKHMHKALQWLQTFARCCGQGVAQLRFALKHRQAVQPRPDARRRPSLQPYRATGILRPQEPERLAAALELAAAHRKRLHCARSVCAAICLQWALAA